MEFIEIRTDELAVASNTPHAGYYVVAATLPGNPIDIVTVGAAHVGSEPLSTPDAVLGDNRMCFYLALHRIRPNKSSSELGSLLRPPLRGEGTKDAWCHVYEEMAQPTEPGYSSSDGVLDLMVMEWLTAAMPSPQALVDDIVRQGLQNAHLDSMPSATQLPTQLMTSRRIGHVYLSIQELAEIYRKREHVTLRKQLLDLNAPNNVPIDRGMLKIRILVQPPLIDIFPRKTNDLLPILKAATDVCNESYGPYITQYIRAFPPFKMPFKLVNTGSDDALHFHVHDDTRVTIGGTSGARFIPDKQDMNDIHMPTGRIDGQPAHVPIHLLFSSVSKSSEHTEEHQSFYGTQTDWACKAMGTTTQQLASAIHTYFNNPPPPGAEPSREILSAYRIYGFILSQMSAALTYRSDIVLSGKGSNGRVNPIQACEDIARDIVTGVTGSCDCEDAAFCIHAVAATILQGSRDIPSATDWQQRDSLWQNVYKPAGFQGGWSHVGLDALQRLSMHTAVVSILGTVTAAFPGEDRAPGTRIRDMDKVEEMYRDIQQSNHPDVREIKHYLYTEDVNRQSTSEAHRWCLALPLRKLVDLVLKGMAEETAVGTVRHANDTQAIRRLMQLSKYIPNIPLPSGTLEGTTPQDFYCVIDPSHWRPGDAELRTLGARARTMSIEFRESILPKWYTFGCMQLDAGPYRHLSGNMETRQGSQFYSRALQLDAWILSKLTDNCDMTTFSCNHGQYGARWGVPVDKLLKPRIASDVSLFSTTHRIAYSIRQKYNEAGRVLQSLLLPASRLGSVNTLMPAPNDQFENPLSIGLETFTWNIYYLRGEMFTDDATVHEYRKQVLRLSPSSNELVEYKQKPLAMGHEVMIWAIRNLQ